MIMLLCLVLTAFLSPAASEVAEDINVSGSWNFTVETSGGSGSPSFVFKHDGEKLTGTYKGLFGTAEIAGSVIGKEIKFSFKVDFQGQAAEITYEGKIEDKDNMKGTVKMAELGEGTWTAKRQ